MRTSLMRALGLALILCTIAKTIPATAEAVDDFYKGKTVNSIVPFGPGGGYALYSQIVQRHLGRFIPGNPQIVLQYRPGAGGIVASNYMYNVAPRDGLTIAMVSDSVALASVIEAEKIKYRVNEFIWLGAIERVNNVLGVRADTGVRDVHDLLKKEIILGSSGTGSPTFLLPALLRWLEPLKIRTIEGFSGIPPMFVAIERGEISGTTVSWTIFKSLRKEWFDKGYLIPLVQFGGTREKDLPNVTLSLDLAKTPQQQAVARFMASNVTVGRSFILPPGVPAERVAALRAAFDRMVQDRGFIDDMTKSGFDVTPATGSEIQDAVAQATKLDDNLARIVRDTIARAK